MNRCIGGIVVTLLFFGSSVVAQNMAMSVPYSTRIFPDEVPAVLARLQPQAALAERPFTLFIVPILLRSSDAKLGQLNAGVALKNTAVPLSVTASYGYLKPSGSTGHFDSFAGQMKAEFRRTGRYSATGVAAYSDTRKASTKTEIGVAGEYLLLKPFSIGTDVRWAERKPASGERVSAVVPTGKAILDFGALSVEGDYTFKNDVDNENGYSAEVALPIAKSKSIVGIGVGKHSTFYAQYIVRF